MNPGTYTVSLKVANSCDNHDVIKKTIEVCPTFKANFAVYPNPTSTNVYIGQVVKLTDISTGSVVRNTWQLKFPDNTTRTYHNLTSLAVPYKQAGACWIKLTVVDECGNTKLVSISFNINSIPNITLNETRSVNYPNMTVVDPISVTSGAFLWGHNDIIISTIEGAMPFQRHYNSRADYTTSLGHRWKHNFDITLSIKSNRWTLRDEKGGEVYFIPSGDGGSQALRPYVKDTLFFLNSFYNLEKINGEKWIFDVKGKLVRKEHPSGNTTYIIYNNNDDIESISFPGGRLLNFEYNSQKHLIKVYDNAGRTLNYKINTQNELVESIGVRGYATRYTYNGRHHMLTVTDPNKNVVVENTYSTNGKVLTQKDANGFLTSFTYSRYFTKVTDPFGERETYFLDDNQRVNRVQDKLGHIKIIEYDDDNNNISTFTDENSNQTKTLSDNFGNIIQIINAIEENTEIEYSNDHLPCGVKNLL